ncbi:MAG: GNAT family N-acetyltransferase [Candidatus Coatesbacteria bacterium]
MTRARKTNPTIRDASRRDLPALAAIRYNEAFHRDRIRDADGRHLRYLVIDWKDRIVGFGLLVLSQPPTWPKFTHLPQLMDLFVEPRLRGRGLGTALILAMERRARRAGKTETRLGVDPRRNRAAMLLYERLGYVPIDRKPVRDTWRAVDSKGVVHAGVEYLIHMRHILKLRQGG